MLGIFPVCFPCMLPTPLCGIFFTRSSKIHRELNVLRFLAFKHFSVFLKYPVKKATSSFFLNFCQFVDLVLFQMLLKRNARSRGFFFITKENFLGNMKQNGTKNRSKIPFSGVLEQVFGYFQYFLVFQLIFKNIEAKLNYLSFIRPETPIHSLI